MQAVPRREDNCAQDGDFFWLRGNFWIGSQAISAAIIWGHWESECSSVLKWIPPESDTWGQSYSLPNFQMISCMWTAFNLLPVT
jgi:hypothetical protein